MAQDSIRSPAVSIQRDVQCSHGANHNYRKLMILDGSAHKTEPERCDHHKKKAASTAGDVHELVWYHCELKVLAAPATRGTSSDHGMH